MDAPGGGGTGIGSAIYRLALSDEGVGTALQIGAVVGVTTVVVALIYTLAVAPWKSRGGKRTEPILEGLRIAWGPRAQKHPGLSWLDVAGSCAGDPPT